jgi:hydrogenase-4 component B
VSEFVIYAGLLNGGGARGTERVVLVATAALLAFVGAASALSMTRAIGLAFLGQPRDRTVTVDRDLPVALNLAMAPHLVGVVAIGLAPAIGLSLVSRAAALFMPRGVSMTDAIAVTQLVSPIAKASLALVVLVFALSFVGRRARRAAPRVETWGCGYQGATPRIQYTGTSFSAPFMKLFESFVRELRREKLPRGYFPRNESRIETHHADAVERRMFEALGNGESFVRQFANRIPEEPRFSFAAGLVAIVVIVALLVRNGGGVP